MAQNITLWGASYSNVPSVLLPKTGGGTASFTDVTDTTASASDVASGTYFYTAAGVRTQGTASGGGGTPNLQTKTNINPTTSSQTITADTGYDGLDSVQINAMPSGSAKPAASISSTGASLSTGTGTIILSKTVSNVPDVTAGYVASGTSGNTAITLQATCTLKGATTYTPGTSNQTIASGTYLTGTQTISGDANLIADNIKNGTTIFGVTGTYSGGGGGSVSYDTKTVTASNNPVSLSFTSMKGQPKFFVVRLNAQVSSSGSTTYYYIVDIVSDGTTTHGNCFRIGSTRRVDNITSGYSWTYSGTTLTVSSSAASRSASPGAFYNGSYELMYAY